MSTSRGEINVLKWLIERQNNIIDIQSICPVCRSGLTYSAIQTRNLIEVDLTIERHIVARQIELKI